jgi:DNA excision repair protein ERCC-4
MTATLASPGLPTLPALKGLGRLADLRPTVICDTREQLALPISRLPVIRAGLQTGDYSFVGGEHLFSVERKSLDDAVSVCTGENRLRFERECGRLRGMKFKRLLIVGPKWMIEAHRYKSAIKPAAVLHSLAAWEMRFDLPVVWADTPEAAAQLVESWEWWFSRELVETTNTLLRASKAAAQPEPATA